MCLRRHERSDGQSIVGAERIELSSLEVEAGQFPMSRSGEVMDQQLVSSLNALRTAILWWLKKSFIFLKEGVRGVELIDVVC